MSSRPRRSSRKPKPRQPLVLYGLLAVIVIAAAWTLIRSAIESPAGVHEPVPGLAVDASFTALVDAHGNPFRREHGDDLLLVTFGFTSCPDICPLTLAAVHQALEALGSNAQRVLPVFVTVDPARDTPAALSAYARAFDPRIVALTGSSDAIARVAKSYRVTHSIKPAGSDGGEVVAHTAVVLLIGASGRVEAAISTAQPVDRIAHGIEEAIAAELAKE